MSKFPRPSAANPADLRREVRLQIVSTCPEIPDGDGWLHEIKHDGYRFVAIVTPDKLTLLSRNGHDRTEVFREPLPRSPGCRQWCSTAKSRRLTTAALRISAG